MKKDTSWGSVADWYAEHLSNPDSYHATVILPNLIRLLGDIKNKSVLDLACGTGFFSKAFSDAGAQVIGVDIGAELIEHARKLVPNAIFYVSAANRLGTIQTDSVDVAVVVLAIQNIKETKETFEEVGRVLKKTGRFFIVLNHPAYRIPKASSWEWDEKNNVQYRRVDQYLSEKTVEIDMHPGKKASGKASPDTVSFHRPLQYYSKLLAGAGFGIAKIEEWISPKISEKGVRQKEEDRIRKEIPLFMLIEVRKW